MDGLRIVLWLNRQARMKRSRCGRRVRVGQW